MIARLQLRNHSPAGFLGTHASRFAAINAALVAAAATQLATAPAARPAGAASPGADAGCDCAWAAFPDQHGRAEEPRTDVVAAYLFGSIARGTAHEGSDVDVAVLFASPPPQSLGGPRFVIEDELERALGAPVDLVVLNDAPVDLRERVLRDGRLLVENDASTRIAFEVRTRNEAFDLEPILRRYRTARQHPA